MQPVGGTPAALSWIAETALCALGALGGRGDGAAALRSLLSVLARRRRGAGRARAAGFVERVGQRWRATDAERADGRTARADPAAATARLNRDGGRLIDRGDGFG
jgi:hypothetical protein